MANENANNAIENPKCDTNNDNMTPHNPTTPPHTTTTPTVVLNDESSDRRSLSRSVERDNSRDTAVRSQILTMSASKLTGGVVAAELLLAYGG